MSNFLTVEDSPRLAAGSFNIIFVMLMLLVTLLPETACPHFTPDQYASARQKLDPIMPRLTQHISTLDKVASELRDIASRMPVEMELYRISIVVEIVEHHSTRAWYNRLLLENISEIRDAVSLRQAGAIIKMSKEPLSNGIHQVNKILARTKEVGQLRLYEQARDEMYSLLSTYNEAIGTINIVIMEGKIDR